jgi:hypothetical protein
MMGNEWYVSAIGHETFINDVISRIGVENAFSDSGWIMNMEYITTKVPDIVIFIADEDLSGTDIKDLLGLHLPKWPYASGDTWGSGADEVKLYYVQGQDGDKFLRAGPRILQALDALLEASLK